MFRIVYEAHNLARPNEKGEGLFKKEPRIKTETEFPV